MKFWANIAVTQIIYISLVIQSDHESILLVVDINRICNLKFMWRYHEVCVSWLWRYCFDGADKIDTISYGLVSYSTLPVLLLIWLSDIKNTCCVWHRPLRNTNHNKNIGVSWGWILLDLAGKNATKSDSAYQLWCHPKTIVIIKMNYSPYYCSIELILRL